MADEDWIQVRYGRGGWTRVDASDWSGPVYARFRDDERGRPVVTELYIDTRGGTLKSADLRKLDLSRLTAVAAEGGRLADPVWKALAKAPGPDLSRLASYFSTSFGRSKHWVADSMLAQVTGSGVAQAPMAADRFVAGPAAVRISAPEDGLTDEFLRDVAAAYSDAVRRGKRPAPELARQAGVSPRTVHSWVAKARDRGIMPRGSRGRVG